MTEKVSRPWHPAPYDEFAAGSVKALFSGNATEHQQKRVVDWILFDLCGVRDLSFRPDSQRDTDFAEGKRFVGLQIVKLSKLNVSALAAPDKPKRKPRTLKPTE